MKYEWDDIKYKSNLKKHLVRFEDAQTVFADPNALEAYDEEHSVNEDRYIRIGSSSVGILYVVFCERVTINNEEVIRIISARRAERDEEDKYYES